MSEPSRGSNVPRGLPKHRFAPPIRFGVLCDGPKIPTWQARSIEELRRVPGTSLALIVFPADKLPDGSRPTSLLFRAYVPPHPPRALRPSAMALPFRGIPFLGCH